MVHRRREGGGRRHKAPELRELLFEWFCRVRGAVASRLPLAALAAQARVLREGYMKNALRVSLRVNVHHIVSHLLQRWGK